jgi:hypothetical protein
VALIDRAAHLPSPIIVNPVQSDDIHRRLHEQQSNDFRQPICVAACRRGRNELARACHDWHGSTGFFLSMAMTAWLTRHSFLLGGLFSIVTLIVGITGYSAVGILLMRQSQGRELSFTDAIIQGIFTVHRMLGVALVLLVIFLLVALLAFAVLFLCKLPGLGSLLYAVMLPLLTVIIGVTFASIFYVAMPLAAPAIWAGNSVMETIARLFVIVRQRLLMTITYIVVLSFLVLFLSGVVSFILFSGYVTTMGISQAVGINPMGNVMGMMSGIMGNHMGNQMGYGGGFEALESGMAYTGAFGFATGLLFSVGMVIPFLTMINGTCLIYLQVTDGLNFTEAEEQLQAQMQEAKRRANEAKDRAGAKLQEAKDAAAQRRPRIISQRRKPKQISPQQ